MSERHVIKGNGENEFTPSTSLLTFPTHVLQNYNWKTPAKHFTAGSVAGLCGILVGHPFDTIRVRLQTNQSYNGILDCILKTRAQEGFRGFYKGISSPLVGVTALKAVTFGTYGSITRLMRKSMGLDSQSLLPLSQVTLAGSITGIVNSVIITPMDRIKILLQLQGQRPLSDMSRVYVKRLETVYGVTFRASNQPRMVFDGAIDVIKRSGIVGLYRGTTPTLAREIVGLGAYFSTFEILKRQFTPSGEETTMVVLLFSGGVTGMVCWTINFPFDAIKSRMQATDPKHEPTTLRTIKKLYNHGGLRTFYKGWAPAMLRAFPVHATILLTYESVMKMFKFGRLPSLTQSHPKS